MRGPLRVSAFHGQPATQTSNSTSKSSEYNREMAAQMGWELNPYEYHWDRGLYYHEVHPNLICGTQPRNVAEVEALHLSGVHTILNVSFMLHRCYKALQAMFALR